MLAGLALVLTACGTPASPAAPTATPTSRPYAGPLWVAPDPALHLEDDPGAAGRVVTCDQPVLGGSVAEPFSIGGEVRESPDAALREARDEGQWSGYDDDGMREVRREPDRALYTYESGGRVLQAVVVRHGRVLPGRGAGADGIAWWVESSARCDVVEYRDGLAESYGSEVWTDAAGHRISSQVVTSSTSDGDCLADGTRVLYLGNGDEGRRAYLRNTADYPKNVGEPFQADVPLPADAVDSGYRHGEERLWFAPDRRRAYVGGPDRVELWPLETEVLGCA
ncbi:hypothetical protein SAMN05421756_102652 [Microlunatus flavus]|uniref:Lipoprotein n=1 Tax=Microlunatus flavus TaxID=1036181 RepID=A0A1H9DU49_9ACTN|nr:hypothetical protein SAMN05421756_102652 [Microlunatus flavus]